MGWRRGPRTEMTRTGERLYVLSTANQVRKALKGKPGFKQCCTVERGIVMIIHTLYSRFRFPKYREPLFFTLGAARRAMDNWRPTRKPRTRWGGVHVPVEYQAR